MFHRDPVRFPGLSAVGRERLLEARLVRTLAENEKPYWLANGTPVTPKVPTEQPRELEADELAERVVTGPVPARVIYRRTPGETAPDSTMGCADAIG
ncbi:winged helix-turn-helix transcriptional regulator [Amycolatopsis coloradensis]|uniref:winged helix-turn-helix transcriptional regulator n=1 Tax=Amycolatopsis coloradensis TaxID=76021 RepID=UPI001FC920BD|nr:winged helix-turn-helix transcriptional regulator [Amycolatopsis coloradensis]